MLTPRPDGRLETTGRIILPLSTTRLQAGISHRGIEKISVWGNGEVGGLSFISEIPDDASLIVEPNRFTARWPGNSVSIVAPPNVPAIIVDFAGRGLGGVRFRRPRARYLGLDPAVHRSKAAQGMTQRVEQGLLAADCPAGSASRGTMRWDADRGTLLIVAGGETEVERVRREPDVDAWRSEATARNEWLASRLSVEDPLLGSMFVHCLHAATSSIKRDSSGRFAGLSAGYGYSLPARTYYRDAYWTIQALLPFHPEIVREEVLLLAHGVHEAGEAPSGVILSSPVGERHWQALRASTEEYRRNHVLDGDWWSDHFDSPLFLLLIALEYASWTGDESLFEERVGTSTIRDLIHIVLDRYEHLGAAAPNKPYNDRDWADNVYRGGLVTYNLGLYYGALSMAGGFPSLGCDAAGLRARRESVRRVLAERLWLADGGYLAEFELQDGTREEHLALETLTAIRFGAVSGEHADSMLAGYRSLLETRNNPRQPYGDWGVMAVYPSYARTTNTRSKSAFAYRYHNGSDWPYWDGAYAELLMQRDDPQWRYPLTRWWEYGLAQGWPEPVEYYSPPWGPGSPLQGWSATPAAAMVKGGFGVAPGSSPRTPPWGDSRLCGVALRGRRMDLVAEKGTLRVEERS